MNNFVSSDQALKKANEVKAFVNLLVENGLIKKEEISQWENKYSNIEDLYQAITGLNIFPNEKIVELYAKAIGFSYIKLTNVDKRAEELLDPSLKQQFGFIPFSVDERSKVLQVAITDPLKIGRLNHNAIKSLEVKLGYRIELFLTSQDSIPNDSREFVQKQREINLDEISIDDSSLKRMPYDIASKYKAVVFKQVGEKEFDVAAASKTPELDEILSYVEKNGDIKLNFYLAPEEQIDRVLKRYAVASGAPVLGNPPNGVIQNGKKDEKTDKEHEKEGLDKLISKTSEESESADALMEDPDLIKFLGRENVSVADLKSYADSNQIPQLLSAMVLLAIRERASDIHIEPFEKSVRIRYRIDGELNDVLVLPSNLNSSVVARIKILSHLKLDEQRVPQDGRFSVKVQDEEIDVRVSTLPTVFGEKAELRLLSKSYQLQKLEDLGLEGKSYDRVIEAVSKPFGVVLSTGPTGSGKSTTLYSILFRLNRPEVNIVTLEDPVEYEIQGINQTQIKPQIGFGFAEGLRSVLRQDPNIIMVGEIRDQATAELVTHAALTGHLVLSTLHTNNASSALPRLINLGVEPFLLTSSVNAVIGQRLVRRICPKCREEVELPAALMYEVKQEFAKINYAQELKFYRGRGCSFCRGGFKGRIGIFEVMTVSEAVEDLVLEKKPSSEIFTQVVKEGMITMKQDGLVKATKGLTTVEEVLRVTTES